MIHPRVSVNCSKKKLIGFERIGYLLLVVRHNFCIARWNNERVRNEIPWKTTFWSDILQNTTEYSNSQLPIPCNLILCFTSMGSKIVLTKAGRYMCIYVKFRGKKFETSNGKLFPRNLPIAQSYLEILQRHGISLYPLVSFPAQIQTTSKIFLERNFSTPWTKVFSLLSVSSGKFLSTRCTH